MNDSSSILWTTLILGLGGLGLYAYKSNTDDNENYTETDNIENEVDEDELVEKDNEFTRYNETLDDFYEPKKRQNNRTKKQKYKKRQSTKRRY